jgi:hypothetical protein
MIKHWMWKRYMAPADGDDGASNGGGDAGGDAGAGGDGKAASGDTSGAAGDGKAAAGGDGKAAPAAKEGDKKGSEGGYWPDDWRARMVAGITDPAAKEKELKQLGRYANPEEVHRKARALEQRLSSGELKSVLPKDAKAEELAAWRAEAGIPETPDKYDLDLGSGLVVGEADKPLVGKFLAAAHATNQTPDQVKASLRAYYEVNEQLNADQVEKDKQVQESSTEALRTEWGPEFRRNVNLINGLLDSTCSPEIKDLFLTGRLGNGTPIGSSPEALKMLLGLALVNNPAGTVVPNSGGNMAGAIDDEITKIETTMKTNRTAYNKDEKMQARYRELLGARETMKARK